VRPLVTLAADPAIGDARGTVPRAALWGARERSIAGAVAGSSGVILVNRYRVAVLELARTATEQIA